MQIEIYNMQTEDNQIKITLEAICDSFSSLLWDIRYYECGQFEIYIAANERNINIFQAGKIVGRNDDREHYGIIEKVLLETDAENGDYFTVSGRFLMSILSRRIIYPTLNFTAKTTYREIIQQAVIQNCIAPEKQRTYRAIPGLQIGNVTGNCWEQKATLQISYENLMDWIYSICKITGGTANIRLQETAPNSGNYTLLFELSEGTDRSILQEENPHLIFSDSYNNLLSFSYEADHSKIANYVFVFGEGEGSERIWAGCTTSLGENRPSGLDLYELYVDARDISRKKDGEGGTTEEIPYQEYTEMLTDRGFENLQSVIEKTESEIAADSLQYVYQKDYFVGDHVTVQHRRFGLLQPKIQLTGMIESFDQNGRKLTPTFELREE